MRVGHLDTAVDVAVVAIKEAVATDRWGNMVESTASPTPAAHGTATAQRILGEAPDAEIYSVAVLPGGETIARLVGGLRWVATQRVGVVCIALGIDGDNVILDQLIEDLCGHDTLVVAAVGNDGAGSVRQPARHRSVLAVGASDEHGAVDRRSGSAFRRDSGVRKPELVAPSTLGTSLACASVAGIAADLRRRHPHASAGDVRHALTVTAQRRPAAPLHRTGAGMVDRDAADVLLRTEACGRPLPEAVHDDAAECWVDPRLQRLVTHAPPERRVRAVVVRESTEVVEAACGDLIELARLPDVRAIGSTTVGTTFLSGIETPRADR